MAHDQDTTALLDRIARQGDAWKNGIPGAREELVKASRQLTSTLTLPSEHMIYTQWAEPAHTMAIRLAFDIQVFEALAEDRGSPKSSQLIAGKTKPKAEHKLVARMLRHLAAMGTIKETAADTFAPMPFAQALTQENFQDSVKFMADWYTWNTLPKEPEYFRERGYTVPTSSVDSVFQYTFNCKGKHLFQYYAENEPLRGKQFASMMDVWSQGRPKWFQEGYYPVAERLIQGAISASEDKDATFLVDVGGGSGHDILQFQEAYKGQIPGELRLQDREEIIELAKKERNLENVVAESHDFLTEQPVKGK
jgi:hypothetical protein